MRPEAADAGYLWDMLDAGRGARALVAGTTLPDAREIDAYFRRSGKVIVALRAREILDEELARKLA